jgi:CubicO group peptidase (beta-lactamase class C family)
VILRTVGSLAAGKVWVNAALLSAAIGLMGLTALGVASAQVALSSRSQPIPRAALDGFVDGAVLAAMEDHDIAGVTVAVVQGGQVVLLRGYGVADAEGTPVDPEQTLFRIGSVSKTFAWLTLLQEADEGRVRLEAPVNDYLPDELHIPDQGIANPLRVIDLMAHATGFEDTQFGHLFVNSPENILSQAQYLQRYRPNRVREPSEGSSYSNYGAALGAEIATLSGGAPDFATLAEQRLLGPAGMTSTTFREFYPAREGLPAPMPEALHARVAQGMTWSGSRFVARDTEYITGVAGAGSAYSTAADMARYMRLWLGRGEIDGVRVYSDAVATQTRTPILQTRAGVNAWAHGFLDFTYQDGLHVYGHNGGTLYFLTNMMMVPDLDLGIFISTNSPGGGALTETLPPRLVRHFYGRAIDPVRPGDATFAQRVQLYAGEYLHSRRAFSGLEGFVGLVTSRRTLAATADGYLSSDGVAEFAPTSDPALFAARQGEALLWFALDGEGRSTSFRQESNAVIWTRAAWWQSSNILLIPVALAMMAAIASLVGACVRFGRKLPASGAQRFSGAAEIVVSGLVLASATFLALWIAASEDEAAIAFDWPGPLMSSASWAALIAALGSVALLALLPIAWRGRDGWSLWRKLRHSGAVVSFVALGAVLFAWGALSPLG